MIPLFVDFSGKKVVIFGGGDVAARKAALFCREAKVTVVSRSFSEKILALPVECITKKILPGNEAGLANLIEGALLVIAALPDPAMNDAIGALCREHGILFNNADGKRGNVFVPSVLKGARYTIGIGTEGMSPAISRYLRELIGRECPDLDGMIGLQERLRAALREKVPSQEERQRIIRAVIHDRDIWEALAKGPEAAWELVKGRYLNG
jgi:precorrin-2 dehydrogenase/sirohydrochlorin ferrochelatase